MLHAEPEDPSGIAIGGDVRTLRTDVPPLRDDNADCEDEGEDAGAGPSIRHERC